MNVNRTAESHANKRNSHLNLQEQVFQTTELWIYCAKFTVCVWKLWKKHKRDLSIWECIRTGWTRCMWDNARATTDLTFSPTSAVWWVCVSELVSSRFWKFLSLFLCVFGLVFVVGRNVLRSYEAKQSLVNKLTFLCWMVRDNYMANTCMYMYTGP